MEGPVNILQTYRIGQLDQRVQILAPTESQGSNGEFTLTWGSYGTFWASVTPAGGQESVISDMLQPVSRARFVFRYDSTITEKYRLVWNSHTFNITSIEVVPRNRFLIIVGESMSLSGSAGVDYGDYYSTNSLKIRIVTGSMASTAPTAAEVNTAVGLTPVTAGAGYIFQGTFTKAAPGPATYYGIFESNGTSWIYNAQAVLT